MSEKSLNIGEADELLFKLNLIYLKESNKELPKIGKISKLSMGDEYKSNNLKIDDLNDIYQKINDIEVQQKLKIACNESNITKAPSGAKSDVIINEIGCSIKSSRGGNPSILNHTHRDGCMNVCDRIKFDIQILDNYVSKYWTAVYENKFGEDMSNDNINSVFFNGKDDLRDFVNYFLFTGTARSDSSFPAKYIITFKNPLDIKTIEVNTKDEYLNKIWNKLVFSLRNKAYKKTSSNKIWARKRDGTWKGSLHIRVKK